MSRVLAVTGMHRSGTSLVANYLARAGIDMGAELIPADVGNPHGYFEDAEIHDLHRRMLRKAGVSDSFTVTDTVLPLPYDAEDLSVANRIVSERSKLEQWGWKEPRTSLYLDLWLKVLPDVKFLFLFRKPDAVMDSLIRRASNPSVVERPVTALEIWRTHYREMLRFAKTTPGRAIWLESDGFIRDPGNLVRSLHASGYRLDPPDLDDVLAPSAFHEEVRMRARAVTRRNRRTWRECMELYDQLRSLATQSFTSPTYVPDG